MLLTLISIVGTAFLTLGLLALYIKRTLPNILEDVAIGASESVTQNIQETLESPAVKRAMSVLGKQSGDSRASAALRNKAANALMEGSPAIKMILDRIGISPLEGLQLMNDPLIGPTIKSFLSGLQKKGPHSPGQGVM